MLCWRQVNRESCSEDIVRRLAGYALGLSVPQFPSDVYHASLPQIMYHCRRTDRIS